MRHQRPVTPRECMDAALALFGNTGRVERWDTKRTLLVPRWAAARCADTPVGLKELARILGLRAFSTVSRNARIVERLVPDDDRTDLRKCIREAALRMREGRRGSMPADLAARVLAAVAGMNRKDAT